MATALVLAGCLGGIQSDGSTNGSDAGLGDDATTAGSTDGSDAAPDDGTTDGTDDVAGSEVGEEQSLPRAAFSPEGIPNESRVIINDRFVYFVMLDREGPGSWKGDVWPIYVAFRTNMTAHSYVDLVWRDDKLDGVDNITRYLERNAHRGCAAGREKTFNVTGNPRHHIEDFMTRHTDGRFRPSRYTYTEVVVDIHTESSDGWIARCAVRGHDAEDEVTIRLDRLPSAE